MSLQPTADPTTTLAPPTPWPLRILAALPHMFAGGALTLVFVGFIQSGLHLSPRVWGFSGWLGYELLACFYAMLLPASMLVVRFVRALCMLPRNGRGIDGTLLLLLPFAWIAWSKAPDGAAGIWTFLGFLLLALGRWLPHRVHAQVDGDLTALARAGFRAVRVWGLFTAAFLLSPLIIFPLEAILGLEMPSMDHNQVFMFLGVGVIYFGLQVLVELLDLGRIFLNQHKKRHGVTDDPPVDLETYIRRAG